VGRSGTFRAVSKIPTAEDESRFWQLIESAWQRVGEEPASRRKALIARESDTEAYGLQEFLDVFLDNLRTLTEGLSSVELTDLDRVLERKLYDIDREEIQEITDGSDDGFLYCRGFIVAMGQDFYEAVNADPSVAVMDAECESMCYFFAHLHNDLFGDWPDADSDISRESASNQAGWSD
jgi:hypothetical protein